MSSALSRGPFPAAFLLPLLIGGCFVEPLAEEPSRLSLQVDSLPPARRAAATFSPWDAQGLFHLEKWPKLVKAIVEAQDFTLASGTWPDPPRGVGLGESDTGEVSIELEVSAGSGRRLRALGFVVMAGEVFVYREEKPLELDLVAGASSEASLRMVPHETGQIELTVRCEQGNTGPWLPTEAALCDATAFVLTPPRPLKSTLVGSLTARFEQAPVGRPQWVRLTVSNGQQYLIVDQRKPTFSVARAGESRYVEVVIPCVF
jgi:hypothetical protein